MRIVRKVAVSGAMNVRHANNVRAVNARNDRPKGKIALPVRPARREKNPMAVVRGVRSVAAKKVVATNAHVKSAHVKSAHVKSAHVKSAHARKELVKTGRAVMTGRGAKHSLRAKSGLAAIWSAMPKLLATQLHNRWNPNRSPKQLRNQNPAWA
jgi:hypothetical protein